LCMVDIRMRGKVFATSQLGVSSSSAACSLQVAPVQFAEGDDVCACMTTTFQVDADLLLSRSIGSHQEATHRTCEYQIRCSWPTAKNPARPISNTRCLNAGNLRELQSRVRCSAFCKHLRRQPGQSRHPIAPPARPGLCCGAASRAASAAAPSRSPACDGAAARLSACSVLFLRWHHSR